MCIIAVPISKHCGHVLYTVGGGSIRCKPKQDIIEQFNIQRYITKWHDFICEPEDSQGVPIPVNMICPKCLEDEYSTPGEDRKKVDAIRGLLWPREKDVSLGPDVKSMTIHKR